MIKVENIRYDYKKGHSVLSDLSFKMEPGRIYGVLGKNGVGKTTLLKIICGLLEPKSGTCLVDDLNPFDRKKEHLQKISFIPEVPYAPDIRIEQLVEITAPFYPTFNKELFNRCLDEFEVPKGNSLNKMSLGQQKKAIISLALACDTPYIIMDEPTNGLDIPSKSTFRKLIASIAGDNRTVIISTHQVRDLENLIDSVLILENDGVLLDTTISSIEDKLYFGPVEPIDMPLYQRADIKGNWGVIPNNSGEPGNVDLEMLFNTVVSNRERIKELFNK